ncbi:MAG TPA: VIT1/CCC1 transporter family protein [Burkholderiaceae bacterium]
MAGLAQDPHAAALPPVDVLVAPDGRVLDPIDRVSEVLFGLFMVLTFTGTLSVATAGREDVRTMLIAAIGCNTAWGFVDGVMYVLRTLVTRSRGATLWPALRATGSPETAQRAIAEHIGPLGAGLDAAALDRLHRWLLAQPVHAGPSLRVTAHDLKAACGVFLLVFASTLPVVLPFLFAIDLKLAMRISAAIAGVMMFYCGVVWARYAGLPRWKTGLALVLVGGVVEAIIIALGG